MTWSYIPNIDRGQCNASVFFGPVAPFLCVDCIDGIIDFELHSQKQIDRGWLCPLAVVQGLVGKEMDSRLVPVKATCTSIYYIVVQRGGLICEQCRSIVHEICNGLIMLVLLPKYTSLPGPFSLFQPSLCKLWQVYTMVPFVDELRVLHQTAWLSLSVTDPLISNPLFPFPLIMFMFSVKYH